MGKIAKEVAESEFERMCAARRVCTDDEELDEDDRASLANLRAPVVRAIMRGELVVEDNGDPVFTPPVPGAKPFHFYRPTGATYMAMDARGKESDANQARMVRAVTEMTRSGPGEIAKLEVPDYQLCLDLANLFLAKR